jgi:hypothetical protein
MENEQPFGLPKRKNVYDEYMGKWIVITPLTGSNSLVGKLAGIEDGHLVINPHQGLKCYEDKGFVDVMKYENAKIPFLGVVIKPTTQEDVENSIKWSNNRQDQPLSENKKNKIICS